MRQTRRLTSVALTLVLGLVSASAGLVLAEDPPKATEGKPAVELTVSNWVNTKDNAALKLADLKGNVVVLKFWATWCGPCKSTLMHFNELTQKYKDKKVTIIGIHDKKECDKMEAFVKRNKLTFACCQDDKGDTSKAYGAKELPFNVLIDKKGVIRKLDAEVNEKEIDKLLAE